MQNKSFILKLSYMTRAIFQVSSSNMIAFKLHTKHLGKFPNIALKSHPLLDNLKLGILQSLMKYVWTNGTQH